MSTVDAAIINYITNGGSSGGGGGSGITYTAGAAISLANNQIAVQYDTNTMELKEGKLSAINMSPETRFWFLVWQSGGPLTLINVFVYSENVLRVFARSMHLVPGNSCHNVRRKRLSN